MGHRHIHYPEFDGYRENRRQQTTLTPYALLSFSKRIAPHKQLINSKRQFFHNFWSGNSLRPSTLQTPPFDRHMHSNDISATSRSPRCESFSPVRPLADEKTPKNQNVKKSELWTTVYPSKIDRTELKLHQNAFQTIPNTLFFDPKTFLLFRYVSFFFQNFSDFFKFLALFGLRVY